jgi:hypothetical protein
VAGVFVATARAVPLIGGLIIATSTTADEPWEIIDRHGLGRHRSVRAES